MKEVRRGGYQHNRLTPFLPAADSETGAAAEGRRFRSPPPPSPNDTPHYWQRMPRYVRQFAGRRAAPRVREKRAERRLRRLPPPAKLPPPPLHFAFCAGFRHARRPRPPDKPRQEAEGHRAAYAHAPGKRAADGMSCRPIYAPTLSDITGLHFPPMQQPPARHSGR